jgi:Family of unknown function (DUF5681)
MRSRFGSSRARTPIRLYGDSKVETSLALNSPHRCSTFVLMKQLSDQGAREAPVSENAGRKQRTTRFQPGQSGNPNGRPPGSRNKSTLAVEALLDGEAEVLTRKAIELAKAGDLVALRLCLDRVCPPRKDRPVNFRPHRLVSLGDSLSRAGLSASLTRDSAK